MEQNEELFLGSFLKNSRSAEPNDGLDTTIEVLEKGESKVGIVVFYGIVDSIQSQATFCSQAEKMKTCIVILFSVVFDLPETTI